MIPTFQMGQFGRSASSGAFVGPLDSYTANLRSAVSIARLFTAYTAGPLNAYNTTSTATHEAVFTSGGALDSGELTTWGGSDTLKVKTLNTQYGTSDKGYDGEADPARYPTLVNAGAYLGSAQFDGASDYLASASYTPTQITIFLRGKIRTPTHSGRQVIIEHTTNPQVTGSFFVWYDNSSDGLRVGNYQASPAGYAISHHDGAYPNDDVQCYRLDRSQTTSALQNVLFINGTKQTRSGSYDTGTLPAGAWADGGMYLGARYGASSPATLNVHTFLVYDAALSDSDIDTISDIIAALP